MSEPQRTEPVLPAPSGETDRAARIEQLLLAGLDQYFGGRYEEAITIWTRVAFLERGHGRARAYIERARGALAERQRESDELLHEGLVAYQAGDSGGARALLAQAVERGGLNETALLLLQRLGRLDAAAVPARPVPPRSEIPSPVRDAARSGGHGASWLATLGASVAIVVAVTVGALAAASWLRELPVEEPPGVSPAPGPLPLVRAADLRLERARALQGEGRLREALETIEAVGPGDLSRAEITRLRADLQRALLARVGDAETPGDGSAR